MDDHRKNIEVRGNERSVQRVVNIFQGGVGGFIVRNFCAPRMKWRKTSALPCYQWALVDAAPTILQIRAFSTLEQKIIVLKKCYFLKGGGGGQRRISFQASYALSAK